MRDIGEHKIYRPFNSELHARLSGAQLYNTLLAIGGLLIARSPRAEAFSRRSAQQYWWMDKTVHTIHQQPSDGCL